MYVLFLYNVKFSVKTVGTHTYLDFIDQFWKCRNSYLKKS
ncbi:hypothetical protein LEP1GSC059_3478 [Leptospira noguchii serovar Panama str. CZ214]|uniref:Uncharacterized protein n=1 Tax=Leptospira noguchii serovar Panama str. CZ214 TaxID=1001595 RepID=T0GPE0_9LEPT|nr:hypothetical protein LEP1GSC059_3478 [Leptospira noguchii serovar Panama str. CZ214]